MKTKTKILIYLIIFAIVDLVIPFPITAVILIYVLFEKPGWFKDYVTDIYEKTSKE
jgi:lipopolysaccharide/colanic/teichoic acid biosynthesis glycosyltransferase